MSSPCIEIVSLAALRSSEAITDEERLGLEAHLASCPACSVLAPEIEKCLGPDPSLGKEEAPPDSRARLERALAEARKSEGAPGLALKLSCTYCHGSLDRALAVYCASCLAPCHEDCFRENGKCAAPGCGETRVVKPRTLAPARPRRKRTVAPLLAVAFAGAVAALGGRIVTDRLAVTKDARCRHNLEEIARAAFQYATDNRFYPYFASDETGTRALDALVEAGNLKPDAMTCPFDEKTHAYEGFTGHFTSNSGSQLLLAWDRDPHPDGTRNAVTLDGHVLKLSEEQLRLALDADRRMRFETRLVEEARARDLSDQGRPEILARERAARLNEQIRLRKSLARRYKTSEEKPGVLTFDNLAQQPDARLLFRIGGTKAGTEYSQIVVQDKTYLDGKLEARLAEGYTPSPGDSFQIVATPHLQGSFTSVEGGWIDDRLLFQIVYEPEAGVRLVVRSADGRSK